MTTPFYQRRVEALQLWLKSKGYSRVRDRRFIASEIIAADPATALLAEMAEALHETNQTFSGIGLYEKSDVDEVATLLNDNRALLERYRSGK